MLTAVGRRVSPARLALNPALRLFRDNVRLKAKTSISFNWGEGFLGGAASPSEEIFSADADISAERVSARQSVLLAEEAPFEEDLFLAEGISSAPEASLAEVDVISGSWSASSGALGRQHCSDVITHLTI